MADVITKVLEGLSVLDIHSALLVNREWCRAAVPIYWKAPFSFTKKRSMTALKIYEMFVEQGGDTVETTATTSSSSSSTKNPALAARRASLFFDYPLFLKELHYTNLLACEETYERMKKVEAILQMLNDFGIRLDTLIMENTGANNERVYGLWTTSRYVSMFSSLVRVEIHTPFPKNNVMKTLAKNCTRLSHLDMNLHDNSIERTKESFDCLEEIFTTRKSPLNLRLVFPNGPGDMLIQMLRSRPESFKRLELVKWDFKECDWGWLKRCPNLIEFAMSISPQTLVSNRFQDINVDLVTDVLGVGYEAYRLKPSKNSKIVTAHWYLNKDDEIPSTYFFHPDKSSTVSYDDQPPVVIQPPVDRKTHNLKKMRYIYNRTVKSKPL